MREERAAPDTRVAELGIACESCHGAGAEHVLANLNPARRYLRHWDGDDDTIVNLTVWESMEALADFVYRTDHVSFLRRRREWFERPDEAYLAMWWVPAGHLPSVAEAVERLDHLRRHGPTPTAFSFRSPFPLPGEARIPTVDERNVCPA